MEDRYLVYRGATHSLLYRYDSSKNELREFVYLESASALDPEGVVSRWRFEGAELEPREDGGVALRRRRDPLGEIKKVADPAMTGRIERFLIKNSNPAFSNPPSVLLVIPPPEFIDGNRVTRREGIHYEIASSADAAGLLDGRDGTNVLELVLSPRAELSFPLWVDPTLRADTDAGVILNGFNNADAVGWSVSPAGDFNGDGLADVIVGAPGANFPSTDAGAAFIFLGRTLTTQINDRWDTLADVRLDGQSNGDMFGTQVASIGDFNGDGKDDVIVGSPEDDNNGQAGSGSAFIYLGRTVSAPITLSPDADADLILDGQSASDSFGGSVGSAGDFNGDGKDDVIVGAAFDGNNGASFSGSAFIFLGRTVTTQMSLRADADADVILDGSLAGDIFGFSVAPAGDFNGDGKGDVIVGASGRDAARQNNGRVYIFKGRTVTSQLNLLSDTDADVIFFNSGSISQGIGDQIGGEKQIASAGDFNGDGKSDVLIGNSGRNAPATVSDSGIAYIFFGRTLTSQVILDVDFSADVTFQGQSAGDGLGSALASAGDVNGDGNSDVIIGANQDDNNSLTDSGTAFIFFGGVMGSFNNPDANADVILNGQNANDRFGRSVAAVGDFNGDTLPDIIAGANGVISNRGAAYIFPNLTGPPSVAFNTTSSSGSEAASSVMIPVSLSTASSNSVTVDYAVTGGTATGNGTDYTLANGTLTFMPGETTKNIAPTIKDDLVAEPDETIVIGLSNPANASLGSNTSHTFTILDDDTGIDLSVMNSGSVIAPYWQADPIAYTFMALSHPSLANMNSQIGVVMTARFASNTRAGVEEFTLFSGETRKVFITQSGGPLSQAAIAFLRSTGALVEELNNTTETNGNLLFQPKASNPEIMLGPVGAPGRGFPDITSLSYWGAVVVAATSTGFAMEFVGDEQNSRVFNTPRSSGMN